eukprot:PLAT15475.5.p1 GENE.PLAT15475.5~~PLAT15475.5.p1  ORF type:complete len:494 (-),score=125.41 PLAT15475.5:10-1491(-)
MSAVDESKCDVPPEAPLSSAFFAVPTEVWGVILGFVDGGTVAALARSSHLFQDIVYSSLLSMRMDSISRRFPAARLTALESVRLGSRVDKTAALSILRLCPELRNLSLFCRHSVASDELLEGLPLLPRLQQFGVSYVVVDGRLGSALASCAELKHLALGTIISPRQRRFPDFLRELSACSALRSLTGVKLLSKEDVTAMCDALACWSELETLSIHPFETPGGSVLAVHGLAAAAAEHCLALRSLKMSSRVPRMLSHDDTVAIGSMSKLRDLYLWSFRLDATFFTDIARLSQLRSLILRAAMDLGWEEIVPFVEASKLRTLSLSDADMPVAVLPRLLRGLCLNRSMVNATVKLVKSGADSSVSVEAGTALAEALCQSSVRRWHVLANTLSFAAFLLAWDAQTPAAAVSKLVVDQCSGKDCTLSEDEFVQLLLACVRSCVTLTHVTFNVVGLPFAADAFNQAVDRHALPPELTFSVYATAGDGVEALRLRVSMQP